MQQISCHLLSQKEKKILGLPKPPHMMNANFSGNICETETRAVFEHIVFDKGLFVDFHLGKCPGRI